MGTRGFSNGEQGIKSKKVKGSWEHAPPPWEGLTIIPGPPAVSILEAATSTADEQDVKDEAAERALF